jgi:hypothetical protein
MWLGKARIIGRNARDFRVVAKRCRLDRLARHESCTLMIAFTPHKRAIRRAKLTMAGLPVTIPLVGTGVRRR